MDSKEEIFFREIKEDEYAYAQEALYNAIYSPDKVLERDIIYQPDIYCYIEGFKRADDICLVATTNERIIGMAWSRIIYEHVKGYGNLDKDTPELAISIEKSYQNRGIGQKLLEKLFIKMKENNYQRVSLSVDKNNYAVKLYAKCGFKIVEENDVDYIMLKVL